MSAEANGSQDRILRSRVNPKVYNVVTNLNSKLKHLNKTIGDYGYIKPISPEDMKWIQNFIESGDIAGAAKEAYGSRIKNKYHARYKGKANLDKPLIKQALHELLEQADYEDTKLLNELSDVIYHSQNPSDKLRGLDMAFKLKGSYAPEKRISANANADFGSLSDAELAEQVDLFITPGDNTAGEDILDEIAIRDGEEAGPTKF